MKYEAWRRSKIIQQEFENSLLYLTNIFKRIAISSGNDQLEYVRRMDEFQISDPYSQYVNSIVGRMITPLATSNMATWRMAARNSTNNPFLYRLLMRELAKGIGLDIQNQIEENSLLIKTLPHDVASKVVNDITKEAYKGLRSSEIAKIIQEKTEKHIRASAKLIARTEVSKATTALTKARCDNLDIRWYVWRTAEDGDRVRKSHRIMNGVIVPWNDPPSPERLANEKDVGNYHAGNIWNCRCYPEPLINLDSVSWPHKVYQNGQIKMVGRKQFEQIM